MLKHLLNRISMRQSPSQQAAETAASAFGLESASLDADEASATLFLGDRRRRTLREAFTPMRPQRNAKRFVGRQAQLARVLQVIGEERGHVVIYAERGRGKTSLANLVADAADTAGHLVARYACTAESDFDAIVRGLVRDLPGRAVPALLPRGGVLGDYEHALPPGRLQPLDIAALAGRLMGDLVFLIDEFDRVLDEATRTRLADTIKHISDRGAPISFVLVGVSDSIDELLGRHRSIQRNVVGVPLPLLSDAEVEELVERGSQEVGLLFSPAVRGGIARLARGVPYVAQLLAFRATRAALKREAPAVSGRDLRAAIAHVVAEADPRTVALYEELTGGRRGGAIRALLQAVASGPHNEFGQFEVWTLQDGSLRMAGAPADPGLWGQLRDAGAVRACRGGPGLFTFGEATFGHYVLMRALRDA